MFTSDPLKGKYNTRYAALIEGLKPAIDEMREGDRDERPGGGPIARLLSELQKLSQATPEANDGWTVSGGLLTSDGRAVELDSDQLKQVLRRLQNRFETPENPSNDDGPNEPAPNA